MPNNLFLDPLELLTLMSPRPRQQGGELVGLPFSVPPPAAPVQRGQSFLLDLLGVLAQQPPLARSRAAEAGKLRQSQEALAQQGQEQERPLVGLALPGQPTHNPLATILQGALAIDRSATRPLLPMAPNVPPSPYAGSTVRFLLPGQWIAEASRGYPAGAALSLGRLF